MIKKIVYFIKYLFHVRKMSNIFGIDDPPDYIDENKQLFKQVEDLRRMHFEQFSEKRKLQQERFDLQQEINRLNCVLADLGFAPNAFKKKN